jgi:uncharacterized protein (TIGR02118 family)
MTPTQRLVFVLRRRPELSRDEFQQYWLGTHAPLVAGVAEVLGITRYQQVHTISEDSTRAAPPFDGVAELWFDPARSSGTRDEQIAAAAMLLEDERRFIDLSASPIWFAAEHVMADGPADALRSTTAVRRRAGLTREEFQRHWREVHGPLAVARPDVFGITRYVQMHTPDDAETYPPAVVRGAPEPYDGLAEVYVTEVQGAAPDAAEVRAALVADTESIIDRDASPRCAGRVHVIVDR